MDQHDVAVIGAGLTDIYQLHRLVALGFDVTLVEAAPDLGGTWYHNRYPGYRFDSESIPAATPSPKNYWKSGIGPNTFLPNLRHSAI